jgi:hypothetical protein
MQAILIQTFHARITDRRGKRVEGQRLGDAGNVWFSEGVDTEKTDEPLVQQQLVAKLVRLLAIRNNLSGALSGSFGGDFFSWHPLFWTNFLSYSLKKLMIMIEIEFISAILSEATR